ncbi:MAG: hypothetical protein JKX92_06140 [Porticoccaceae bacterium]|nr:hypothetical protein [Porticoccaceae bacterium]
MSQQSLAIRYSRRPHSERVDEEDDDDDLIIIDQAIVDELSRDISQEALEDIANSVAMLIREGGPASFEGRGFQVFPALSAKVFATSGTIIKKGRRQMDGLTAVVVFAGSDSASAPHPITSLGSVKALTDIYSAAGAKVSARPSRDAESYSLVADEAIYGTFEITYATSYTQYYWAAEDVEEGAFYLQGAVIAYYQGSSASLEFGWGDAALNFDKTEIYRVTSKYVVDSEGAWEYPPNWPDDTSYSQSSTNHQPDSSAAQVIERVHYIGYVNRRGGVSSDWFVTSIEEPFTGHSSYRPQYQLSLTTSPPDGFAKAFDALDFGAIKDQMSDAFPNIEV